MIEKLKHIVSESQRFYILGITKIGDKHHYDLIELLFKNQEIKIENRFFSTNLEDLLKERFKKPHPVLLHFEGDNVINKLVENKAGYRNNLIFKANPEDFYFYEYHQDNSVFLSVMRKSSIEEVIQKFNELNYFVINVSFGPFVMANIISVIQDYKTICSPNYKLEIANNKLLSFENNSSNQESYTLNGESFTIQEIPLIAAFFDYEFPNSSIFFDNTFLTNNKSEFTYSKWFKKLGIFTIVFILMSLFVGHHLLNYYLESLTKKQLQYSFSQQTISTIENLRSDVELKEKILLTSGLNNTKFLTYYVADIGNSVMDNITINSIDVNPTIKKIKSEEKINFDLNTIHITGEAFEDKAFNDWINKMKAFEWIDKIDIVDYSKETNNSDAFKITIKL